MDKLCLEVGGKELPCRLTMGAMLLFKRNMGKDVGKVFQQMADKGEADLEDVLMLMWCCIVCACKADGVEFGMDFETFTCHITPDDVSAWNKILAEQNKEKKSEVKP